MISIMLYTSGSCCVEVEAEWLLYVHKRVVSISVELRSHTKPITEAHNSINARSPTQRHISEVMGCEILSLMCYHTLPVLPTDQLICAYHKFLS